MLHRLPLTAEALLKIIMRRYERSTLPTPNRPLEDLGSKQSQCISWAPFATDVTGRSNPLVHKYSRSAISWPTPIRHMAVAQAYYALIGVAVGSVYWSEEKTESAIESMA